MFSAWDVFWTLLPQTGIIMFNTGADCVQQCLGVWILLVITPIIDLTKAVPVDPMQHSATASNPLRLQPSVTASSTLRHGPSARLVYYSPFNSAPLAAASDHAHRGGYSTVQHNPATEKRDRAYDLLSERRDDVTVNGGKTSRHGLTRDRTSPGYFQELLGETGDVIKQESSLKSSRANNFGNIRSTSGSLGKYLALWLLNQKNAGDENKQSDEILQNQGVPYGLNDVKLTGVTRNNVVLSDYEKYFQNRPVENIRKFHDKRNADPEERYRYDDLVDGDEFGTEDRIYYYYYDPVNGDGKNYPSEGSINDPYGESNSNRHDIPHDNNIISGNDFQQRHKAGSKIKHAKIYDETLPPHVYHQRMSNKNIETLSRNLNTKSVRRPFEKQSFDNSQIVFSKGSKSELTRDETEKKGDLHASFTEKPDVVMTTPITQTSTIDNIQTTSGDNEKLHMNVNNQVWDYHGVKPDISPYRPSVGDLSRNATSPLGGQRHENSVEEKHERGGDASDPVNEISRASSFDMAIHDENIDESGVRDDGETYQWADKGEELVLSSVNIKTTGTDMDQRLEVDAHKKTVSSSTESTSNNHLNTTHAPETRVLNDSSPETIRQESYDSDASSDSFKHVDGSGRGEHLQENNTNKQDLNARIEYIPLTTHVVDMTVETMDQWNQSKTPNTRNESFVQIEMESTKSNSSNMVMDNVTLPAVITQLQENQTIDRTVVVPSAVNDINQQTMDNTNSAETHPVNNTVPSYKPTDTPKSRSSYQETNHLSELHRNISRSSNDTNTPRERHSQEPKKSEAMQLISDKNKTSDTSDQDYKNSSQISETSSKTTQIKEKLNSPVSEDTISFSSNVDYSQDMNLKKSIPDAISQELVMNPKEDQPDTLTATHDVYPKDAEIHRTTAVLVTRDMSIGDWGKLSLAEDDIVPTESTEFITSENSSERTRVDNTTTSDKDGNLTSIENLTESIKPHNKTSQTTISINAPWNRDSDSLGHLDGGRVNIQNTTSFHFHRVMANEHKQNASSSNRTGDDVAFNQSTNSQIVGDNDNQDVNEPFSSTDGGVPTILTATTTQTTATLFHDNKSNTSNTTSHQIHSPSNKEHPSNKNDSFIFEHPQNPAASRLQQIKNLTVNDILVAENIKLSKTKTSNTPIKLHETNTLKDYTQTQRVVSTTQEQINTTPTPLNEKQQNIARDTEDKTKHAYRVNDIRTSRPKPERTQNNAKQSTFNSQQPGRQQSPRMPHLAHRLTLEDFPSLMLRRRTTGAAANMDGGVGSKTHRDGSRMRDSFNDDDGKMYISDSGGDHKVPRTSAYMAQDFSLRKPEDWQLKSRETPRKDEESAPPKSQADKQQDSAHERDSNTTTARPVGAADDTPGFPVIKPPVPRARAAVSAVLTSHFGPTKQQIIPFDLELLDMADNYDNSTGMFIATIPGTYVISVYLMSHPGAKVNARVYVNDRPVAALWADDSAHAGFYPSSSVQTISQLGFGDQVYVMLVDGGYGDSWVHANYNVFTVFLLYEETFS